MINILQDLVAFISDAFFGKVRWLMEEHKRCHLFIFYLKKKQNMPRRNIPLKIQKKGGTLMAYPDNFNHHKIEIIVIALTILKYIDVETLRYCTWIIWCNVTTSYRSI